MANYKVDELFLKSTENYQGVDKIRLSNLLDIQQRKKSYAALVKIFINVLQSKKDCS